MPAAATNAAATDGTVLLYGAATLQVPRPTLAADLLPKGCGSLRDQLDRASVSIVLNLARACGRAGATRRRGSTPSRRAARRSARPFSIGPAVGRWPKLHLCRRPDDARSIVQMLVGWSGACGGIRAVPSAYPLSPFASRSAGPGRPRVRLGTAAGDGNGDRKGERPRARSGRATVIPDRPREWHTHAEEIGRWRAGRSGSRSTKRYGGQACREGNPTAASSSSTS